MNSTQKEIVTILCKEYCAYSGDPPCFDEAVAGKSWVSCQACGRIASIVTDKLIALRIEASRAMEALDGVIVDPGNYDHEAVCDTIDRALEARGVLECILEKTA